MIPKQFSIRYIIGTFVFLALIGLFNRIVDPFWYYRDIEIKGFNAVKTQFEYYERHVKPALLIRNQPKAIILGRSYSEMGLDPTNPLFTNQGYLKSMNFALMGAPWNMVQCEFEFAVSHAPIKRVLIDLTPGNLPLANCAKDFASIGQVSTMQLLFSERALQASISTIKDQKKMPRHTREGMYLSSHQNASGDYQFKEFFLQRTREFQKIKKDTQCLKPIDASSTATNLSLGKTLDLSGLQHMIQITQERGIELVLFVPPRHAYMLELDKQCGEQDTTWQAMKQISALIDAASAKGGRIRAYQFYGYNELTTEGIGTTPTRYWYDPVHFRPEMGNLMLADMFYENPLKIGFPLTATNIDKDYQAFLQSRTEYLQHHPEFQPRMQKLLQLQ